MHQLIEAEQWKISRECKKLIECLPTLVRDMQRNSEDVLKVDHSENYVGDDPADCARYGLAEERITVVGKPHSLRLKERVQEIVKQAAPDMMVQYEKAIAEGAKHPTTFPIKRKHWRFAR